MSARRSARRARARAHAGGISALPADRNSRSREKGASLSSYLATPIDRAAVIGAAARIKSARALRDAHRERGAPWPRKVGDSGRRGRVRQTVCAATLPHVVLLSSALLEAAASSDTVRMQGTHARAHTHRRARVRSYVYAFLSSSRASRPRLILRFSVARATTFPRSRVIKREKKRGRSRRAATKKSFFSARSRITRA